MPQAAQLMALKVLAGQLGGTKRSKHGPMSGRLLCFLRAREPRFLHAVMLLHGLNDTGPAGRAHVPGRTFFSETRECVCMYVCMRMHAMVPSLNVHDPCCTCRERCRGPGVAGGRSVTRACTFPAKLSCTLHGSPLLAALRGHCREPAAAGGQ